MNEVRTKRGLAYGAYMTLGERRGVGGGRGVGLLGHRQDRRDAQARAQALRRAHGVGRDDGPGGVLPALPHRLARLRHGRARAPAGRARLGRDRRACPPTGSTPSPARRAVTARRRQRRAQAHVHARDLAITMVASAPVMKKLLVEAKIKESDVDVVPFDSY